MLGARPCLCRINLEIIQHEQCHTLFFQPWSRLSNQQNHRPGVLPVVREIEALIVHGSRRIDCLLTVLKMQFRPEHVSPVKTIMQTT